MTEKLRDLKDAMYWNMEADEGEKEVQTKILDRIIEENEAKINNDNN